MSDFSDKTAEELREAAEWYDHQGWEANKAEVHEELRARGEPLDPDSEVVGNTEASLKDQYEWFQQQGWKANAEKVAEEMVRQGVDHPAVAELRGAADDDLTAVSHV